MEKANRHYTVLIYSSEDKKDLQVLLRKLAVKASKKCIVQVKIRSIPFAQQTDSF